MHDWTGRATLAGWLLVGAGVVLRIRTFLADRSLWLDEAMLANNILNRSFAGLMEPLASRQVAPFGYLALSRGSTLLFGPDEAALRLPGFVAGVTVVLLLFAVARVILPFREALIVVALGALLPPLIYYSAELKQYSLDTAVSLGIVLLALQSVRSQEGTRLLAVLPPAAALAVWFSHPVAFVIAAVCVFLFVTGGVDGRRPLVVTAMATAALSLVSFGVNQSLVTVPSSTSDFMRAYWSRAFAPFPPTSLRDFWWYPTEAFAFFRVPIGFDQAHGLALGLALGGVAWFWRRRRGLLLLLLVPGLLHLAASSLGLFPWGGRVSLYLVPFGLLLLGGGLSALGELLSGGAKPIYGIFVALLFLGPVGTTASHFLNPPGREELRSVLEQVQPEIRPQDLVFVDHHAYPAFHYYVTNFPQFAIIAGAETFTGTKSTDDWDGYAVQLASLPPSPRVWLVMTGLDEERLMVYLMDRLGIRIGEWRAAGAAAHLYERSGGLLAPRPP